MTPASRVHLVRHGQVHNPMRKVYGRQAGWSLSEKGRLQAEEAARALAGRGVAALYSSPLERARETAAILAGALGVPVQVREDLMESALAARWEGMTWPEVWATHHREWLTYRRHPLDVDAPEPLTALARRMSAAVREMVAAHPGREVVAVSHGDPIKAAVLSLTGDDLSRVHDLKLRTGGRIALDVWPDGRVAIAAQDA
jgi:broad specificity phosphatase PhoE